MAYFDNNIGTRRNSAAFVSKLLILRVEPKGVRHVVRLRGISSDTTNFFFRLTGLTVRFARLWSMAALGGYLRTAMAFDVYQVRRDRRLMLVERGGALHINRFRY